MIKTYIGYSNILVIIMVILVLVIAFIIVPYVWFIKNYDKSIILKNTSYLR